MGKGIFFTSASILLAVFITATIRHHLHHHHHHHHHNPPLPNYTSNASKLLRSHGFTLTSNFLHISPEQLSLSNPNSPLTVFAVPDTAISNLSVRPYMIKTLIAHHTSPTKLTLEDLLNKPLKTCLPTLIPNQTVTITKIDYKKRVLEINNVLITHPDLFLDGHVTIHGIAGSFATFDHQHNNIVLPSCELDNNIGLVKNKDEWKRMIKFLGSSGFMAFAIGLETVTDGIFKDFKNLNSVTVFVTRNVVLRAMSSPLLDRFMRVHVVMHRYSFKELVGLPPGATLSTLVIGKHVVVSENLKVSKGVMIDGVSITVPDLFVSKNLVVHGIARALSMDELSSMSR